jgi:cbb3-type cytochrome oxidase maturation protein
MPSPLDCSAFVFMWIGFTVLMICCIAGFFLWAVRADQFSDQDRARYLPLDDWLSEDDRQPESADRNGHRSLP